MTQEAKQAAMRERLGHSDRPHEQQRRRFTWREQARNLAGLMRAGADPFIEVGVVGDGNRHITNLTKVLGFDPHL